MIAALLVATIPYFSPAGGARDALIAAIRSAKVSAHVAIYEFTDKGVADELVAAKARSVDVQVVIDESARSKVPCAICGTTVPVCFDAKHPIFHDKYVVIDGAAVVTGSYNWTYAANVKNAENLLVIKSKKVGNAFEQDWAKHRAHCAP